MNRQVLYIKIFASNGLRYRYLHNTSDIMRNISVDNSGIAILLKSKILLINSILIQIGCCLTIACFRYILVGNYN